MKVLLPALLMLVCGMLAALTNADIQFLLDTEQYQLLKNTSNSW